jgi:hypothetical protein
MSRETSGARGKPFAAMGAGISDEAKLAMTAAFDAMSNWRADMAATAERNSSVVFDKMAVASKAVGWPAEFVDLTKQQMQQASKMQMQIVDQVMDVWEQQVKQPGAGFQMPGSGAMAGSSSPFPGMPQFPGMPNFPGMPQFPGMPNFPQMDFSTMPMSPIQFWMQAADMWQKNWQTAMTSWTDAQSNMMGGTKPGNGSRPGTSR